MKNGSESEPTDYVLYTDYLTRLPGVDVAGGGVEGVRGIQHGGNHIHGGGAGDVGDIFGADSAELL